MLAFNRFATPVSIDVDEVDQPLLLALGTGAPSTVYLDGRQISANDTWSVCTPGRQIRIDRQAGSQILHIKIPYATLEQHLECILGKPLEKPLILMPTCPLNGTLGAHLHRTLEFIIAELTREPSLASLPFWRNSYDELLMNLLAGLESNHSNGLEGESPSVPERLVRIAEAYIETHCAEPVRIADVLAECGCPRRQLFRAFKRYRGYSPRQFLEDTRLRRAHQDLKANSTQLVTQVALRWGFSHLGRFSRLYREKYGQSPSETLSEKRGFRSAERS